MGDISQAAFPRASGANPVSRSITTMARCRECFGAYNFNKVTGIHYRIWQNGILVKTKKNVALIIFKFADVCQHTI